MNPVERFPRDDPREWLNRARSNLARARALVPTAYIEDACFDAQQAAEKAIKAVMVGRGIDFPYIHDLNRLLEVLEADGEQIPDEVWLADGLTLFATAARYPGLDEPVTEQDHREAVELAAAVLRWAETRI